MKKSILMLLLVPMFAIGQTGPHNELTASAKVYSHSKSTPSENSSKVKALIKYTGHYKSELIPDFEIDVFVEGNKLFGIKKGDAEKVEISPVGTSKFLVKGSQIQIQFMEENGEVQFMMVAEDEMTWLKKED